MFEMIPNEIIPSTQDLAREEKHLFKPDVWRVYTAEEQTKGRGTKNRKWASPPRVNIYVTYGFLIPVTSTSGALLPSIPQVTALSVAQMLQSFGLKPTFKWVNDVLLDRKKMCGILSEAENIKIDGKEYFAVFLGVGVNVNMSKDICVQLDQPVTSMSVSAGKQFDKNEVLTRLNNTLHANIETLLSQGFRAFYTDINQMLEKYDGEEIIFDITDAGKTSTANDFIKGRITGINHEGHLQLTTSTGDRSFLTGRVLKGLEAEEAMYILAGSESLQTPSFRAFITNTWKNAAKNKLFKDDYMNAFAMPLAQTEAEKQLPKNMWLNVALKHKYFIKAISKFIRTSETKQVIFLGGGYTTVPVRKSKYPVKFFELDQKEILDRKERIYAHKGIEPNSKLLSIDYLNEDFVAKLKASGVDVNSQTHFILEGDASHLPKEVVSKIIKNIKDNFPNFLVSFDYERPADIQEVAAAHQLNIIDQQTAAQLATQVYKVAEVLDETTPQSLFTLKSKL